MARRPNYGFEKRQKEIDRQKKKDAKTERKELRKKEMGGGEGETPEEGDSSDDEQDQDDRG